MQEKINKKKSNSQLNTLIILFLTPQRRKCIQIRVQVRHVKDTIETANSDQLLSKCHFDISLAFALLHLIVCIFFVLITKTQSKVVSRTIEILGKSQTFFALHTKKSLPKIEEKARICRHHVRCINLVDFLLDCVCCSYQN